MPRIGARLTRSRTSRAENSVKRKAAGCVLILRIRRGLLRSETEPLTAAYLRMILLAARSDPAGQRGDEACNVASTRRPGHAARRKCRLPAIADLSSGLRHYPNQRDPRTRAAPDKSAEDLPGSCLDGDWAWSSDRCSCFGWIFCG
jgi:hypothetical protein